MEALVRQIFFPWIVFVLRPRALLCPVFAEGQPAGHHIVVFFQDGLFARCLIQRPGHQNAGVAPPGAALEHHGDPVPLIVDRRDILHQTVFCLGKPAFSQPFAQYGITVHEIHGGRGEYARVARPASPLSCRAVGRDIAEIGAHTPQAVLKQPVHVRVPTGEKAGLLHLGIHGDGRELRIRQIHICFNLCIAEAVNGKGRFVHVQAVFTGIYDLLGNASVLVAIPRRKVALRKIPVFIQSLPVPQGDPAARSGSDTKLRVPSQVLAEVNNCLAAWRLEDPAGEALVLHNRHAFCWRKISKAKVPQRHAVPIGDLLHPGVIVFTDFQVILPDGTGLTGLPGLITAEYRASRHVDLTEQGKITAVIVVQAVNAYIAAIPAVAQDHEHLVLTGFQQLCHIKALHAKTPAVIPGAGGQHKISDPLPVQVSSVQAMAGNIQAGPCQVSDGKTSAQIRRGLPHFSVMRQLRVDPTGLPDRQACIPDHHISTSLEAILH